MYLLFEFDFLGIKLRSKKSVALMDPFQRLQFYSSYPQTLRTQVLYLTLCCHKRHHVKFNGTLINAGNSSNKQSGYSRSCPNAVWSFGS